MLYFQYKFVFSTTLDFLIVIHGQFHSNDDVVETAFDNKFISPSQLNKLLSYVRFFSFL